MIRKPHWVARAIAQPVLWCGRVATDDCVGVTPLVVTCGQTPPGSEPRDEPAPSRRAVSARPLTPLASQGAGHQEPPIICV